MTNPSSSTTGVAPSSIPTERNVEVTSNHAKMNDLKLDNRLFVVVVIVLFALIAILSTNLYFQYGNYRSGIRAALKNPEGVSHVAVLSYSRAWDFATVKTSALFLSFLLIFIGCLYVLRSAETKFEISGEKGDAKGALSLSSPGLALVFFGVFLTSVVILNKSSLDYSSETTVPVASQVNASGSSPVTTEASEVPSNVSKSPIRK